MTKLFKLDWLYWAFWRLYKSRRRFGPERLRWLNHIAKLVPKLINQVLANNRCLLSVIIPVMSPLLSRRCCFIFVSSRLSFVQDFFVLYGQSYLGKMLTSILCLSFLGRVLFFLDKAVRRMCSDFLWLYHSGVWSWPGRAHLAVMYFKHEWSFTFLLPNLVFT